MTRKELEEYKSIKEKLEKETLELFCYIKEKHLDVLKFDSWSSYHHFVLCDKTIYIEYYDDGYDCYDSSGIEIPIDDFLNRPKEWADEWANEIREERKKEKQKQLEYKEKRERKELQRLKENTRKENKVMTQICITPLLCLVVLNGLIIGALIMELLDKRKELQRLKEKYEKGD